MELLGGAVLSAAVFVIVSLWIIRRKRALSVFQRYGIPGPKPSFWTGNLSEFIEKRENCVSEWIKKYGNIVGFYFGAKPMLIVCDVDLLKTIQVKEFQKFSNKDLILSDAGVPHKVVLKSLELQKDERWKKARSCLSASLSSGKIKRLSPIFAQSVEIFLRNVKQQSDKPFDILNLFKKLTFDSNSKALFGIETDVQNNKTSKFIESVYDVFSADSSDILASISVCFPELEPLLTNVRHLRDGLRYLMNKTSTHCLVVTCQKIIESRKQMKSPPNDVLQYLIEASSDGQDNFSVDKDPLGKLHKLTDEEALANAMGFMAAGYDTTSNTLGYCTYLLGKNPDIQEKVRKEINNNFKPGEEIDYAGLANLQYMDQAISETLRLFHLALPWYLEQVVGINRNIGRQSGMGQPMKFKRFLVYQIGKPLTGICGVGCSINRVCKEDFKYNGITIPKGAMVVVPLWSLHKDPEVWEEPENFNPDRFSSENRGAISPFVYQPFGSGPRICIGMRLALFIIKYVLANLLRRYKLETCDDGKELELEYSLFIIKAKNGIRVKAVPV